METEAALAAAALAAAGQSAAAGFALETGQQVAAPNLSSATAGVPAAAQKFYTEEDLNRVRETEKSKLYPTVEALKAENAALVKARQDEQDRLAAEQAARDAEARAKAESEMDIRTLREQDKAHFEAQLALERDARERFQIELQREREYAALQAYTTQAVDAARETIAPELLDLVIGNTPEEVDRSIAALADRSSRIFESFQQASQTARREMVGTRPTLPAAGPLEINSGQRTYTTQQVADMSQAEYAEYRKTNLSDAARGVTHGLFG